MSNEAIVQHALQQLRDLFPSAQDLNMTWSSVVKLAQSLYREKPGMDPFRPTQTTRSPISFWPAATRPKIILIVWKGPRSLGSRLRQLFWLWPIRDRQL